MRKADVNPGETLFDIVAGPDGNGWPRRARIGSYHLDWPRYDSYRKAGPRPLMQTVGLLQFAPHSRSFAGNVTFIAETLATTHDAAIALPEFFLGSYVSYEQSWDRHELAELLRPLCDITAENRLSLVGSLPVRKADRNANNIVILHHGTLRFSVQDKLRLFGTEEADFTSGVHRGKVTVGALSVSIQVCMDIVDPLPVRAAVGDGARVVFGPSAVSVDFLRTIHKARSLENQAVNIFCNRTGKDVDGTIYLGRSAIFFPDGAELSAPGAEEQLLTATVDFDHVVGYKIKFGVS